MATIAEVKRQGSESSSSLLRRFTKRVQATGAVKAVKARRYAERVLSDLKTKRRALDRLEKRAHYEKLRKMGKLEQSNDKRRR